MDCLLNIVVYNMNGGSDNAQDDCDRIVKKYKMLRIRQKISWSASQSNMTVQELFLTAILKTCTTFARQGSLRISLLDFYKQ